MARRSCNISPCFFCIFLFTGTAGGGREKGCSVTTLMYDSTEKGWDLFPLRIMQCKLAQFADAQEYEDGCLSFRPVNLVELSIPCSA